MAVNVPINFLANVDDAAKEFNKLSFVFKGLVAAFAVDKIIDGLKSSVNEAIESEKSFQRLTGALKAAGDFSQKNANAFSAYADQIAKVTKYDDDLIISQFAVAKQFNTSNAEAVKLVKAATDLSAVTGIDLNQATELLGRSLDGTAGRLNELIPDVRKLTAEQLLAGGAIDLVASKFKDAAAGELNTFSGALGKTQQKFNDVVKAIGKLFTENEVLKIVIKELGRGFEVLANFISDNSAELKGFISGGIIAAIKAFEYFSRTLDFVNSVISGMIAGFKTLGYAIGSVGRFISDIAKGDLKKAFSIDVEASEKFRESINKTNESFEDRSKSIQGAVKFANSFAVQLEKVAEKQEKVKKVTIENNNEFDDALKKAREMAGEYEKQLKLVEEQRKEWQGYLKNIRDNPISDMFLDKSNTQGISAYLQQEISRGLGVVGAVLQGKSGATKLLSGFAETMGEAFLGIPGFGALFEALAQGPEKVKEMVKEFARAVPDIIQAVAESIPVVIEEMADRAPEIIERLIEKAPQISFAIVKALSIALPAGLLKAVERFNEKLLEGASKFVEKLIESIGNAFKGGSDLFQGITPGGGGIGGGGAVGGAIGGAIGGIVAGPVGGVIGAIGGGGFWKGGGGGGTIVVPVQIDRKEIANVVVDLNRYGYRLVPT